MHTSDSLSLYEPPPLLPPSPPLPYTLAYEQQSRTRTEPASEPLLTYLDGVSDSSDDITFVAARPSPPLPPEVPRTSSAASSRARSSILSPADDELHALHVDATSSTLLVAGSLAALTVVLALGRVLIQALRRALDQIRPNSYTPIQLEGLPAPGASSSTHTRHRGGNSGGGLARNSSSQHVLGCVSDVGERREQPEPEPPWEVDAPGEPDCATCSASTVKFGARVSARAPAQAPGPGPGPGPGMARGVPRATMRPPAPPSSRNLEAVKERLRAKVMEKA